MTAMRHLTLLGHNFEVNGAGDAVKRHAMHATYAALGADLLFRQEMWDADADGGAVLAELEGILGMRGWVGPGCCTAVFAKPDLFEPIRQWPDTWPMWILPPTALTLRLRPAGPEAVPLLVVSYHLNYASATNRLAEAEALTVYHDQRWTLPGGRSTPLPLIAEGDNNSYRGSPRLPGQLEPPTVERARHERYFVHRSHPMPDGSRAMDTRPDDTLRAAGLIDLGRQLATERPTAAAAALAPTVNSGHRHGADYDIDRFYASQMLTPAVTSMDVVEVKPGESDHHIVRLRLDRDVLCDILNALAADPPGPH
ncbi:endonuclease/exonuclease/phosphatase family protein [Streptomyces scopuliridis]|uniref:endonuclease/exonuclease/phosphatase family protein n=1 Tax=Streptomyces scopuliridis TaxID=452529 RepID=UPI00341FACFE